MKHIYSILFACSFLSVLSGCIEDPEMDTKYQNAKAPEVSMPEVTDKKASALTLKATIVKENGLPVLESGVCWSTNEEDTGLNNLRNNRKAKAERVDKGEFTVQVSNLEDDTYYYIYSYAINQKDRSGFYLSAIRRICFHDSDANICIIMNSTLRESCIFLIDGIRMKEIQD